MRTALIGILFAATAISPLQAQDSDQREVRDQARSRVSSEARAERRAERDSRVGGGEAAIERRQERREVRQEPFSGDAGAPRARPAPRNILLRPRSDERSGPAVERDIGSRADRRERDSTSPVETRRIPTNMILRPRTDSRADGREDRRGDRFDRRADRRDDRRDDRAERRDDRSDVRQDRRAWNRDWRSDRRYDWQRYRYSNRGLFSLGSYYSPIWGDRYSRFSIGLRLGSPFYSQRYWIDDPWRYRLPPAYAGTRWVRYYDDVLLVDLFSGQIVDVIHNFFW